MNDHWQRSGSPSPPWKGAQMIQVNLTNTSVGITMMQPTQSSSWLPSSSPTNILRDHHCCFSWPISTIRILKLSQLLLNVPPPLLEVRTYWPPDETLDHCHQTWLRATFFCHLWHHHHHFHHQSGMSDIFPGLFSKIETLTLSLVCFFLFFFLRLRPRLSSPISHLRAP